MTPEVTVAVISFCGTLAGTLGGILAANKLTTYRIEQLEKKVEKHNNVVDRTVILETKMNAVEDDIKELKEAVIK